VSLTPGTVSIDIDRATRMLRVHALNVADEAELIATIKRRYEAPLKEVFGC
jgi:multicomponent K+:H+ antiporter subunit E